MKKKCVCEISNEKLNHYMCFNCNHEKIDFSDTFCKNCILEEHSTHQIVSIHQIFKKALKKIISFERTYSYSQNCINKMEEEFNSIKKELDQISKKLQNHISMLNRKITNLYEKISEEKKNFDKYVGIMNNFQKIVKANDVSKEKDSVKLKLYALF